MNKGIPSKIGIATILLIIVIVGGAILWYLKNFRVDDSISNNSSVPTNQQSEKGPTKKPLFSLEGYDSKIDASGLSRYPRKEATIVVSDNYDEAGIVDVQPNRVTIAANNTIIHQRDIPDGWKVIKPVFGKHLNKYAYTIRKIRASVTEKDPATAILVTDSINKEFDWLADVFAFNEKGDIAYLASKEDGFALYINSEPVVSFDALPSTEMDFYKLFFSDDGKYVFLQLDAHPNKTNSFAGRVDLMDGNKWEILSEAETIRGTQWSNDTWALIEKDAEIGQESLIVNGKRMGTSNHISDVLVDKEGNIGYVSCNTKYFEDNCYRVHMNDAEYSPIETGSVDLLAISSDGLPIYTIGNSQPVDPGIDDGWMKYYLVKGNEKISSPYVSVRLLKIMESNELVYEATNAEKIYDERDTYIVVKGTPKKLADRPILPLKLSEDSKYISYPIIEGNSVYLVKKNIGEF